MIVALVLLTVALGGGRGIVLGLALLPLPALVLIYRHRDRTPRRAPREAVAPEPRRWRGMRAVVRTLVAVPLAAAAATLVTVQIVRPITELTTGIITALIITTSLWTLAMLWAVIDPKLRRTAGGITLAALIAAAPLVLR